MRWTVRAVVCDLRDHRRSLRAFAREQRSWLFRQHLQFVCYAWWCQMRGRPLRLPACGDSPGGEYRTTRQIPGIALNILGRRLWLIVPVALERTPLGEDLSAEANGKQRV